MYVPRLCCFLCYCYVILCYIMLCYIFLHPSLIQLMHWHTVGLQCLLIEEQPDIKMDGQLDGWLLTLP